MGLLFSISIQTGNSNVTSIKSLAFAWKT